MPLPPVIAIHLAASLGATIIGPVALWARLGLRQRPRLHRAFGYAWATLMLASATSAIFIRSERLPSLAGYSPIHLLVPAVYLGLLYAFLALARGDIRRHRRRMLGLYIGGCLIAGVFFTLQPTRYLGRLVWGQWLGLL